MHDNPSIVFLLGLLLRLIRLFAIEAKFSIDNGASHCSSPVREFIAFCVLCHHAGITINFGGPSDLPISMTFRGVTVGC